MSVRDYYEVLGVSRGASADEIRRAYRAKARQFHPDVNKAPDAAERFAELQQAYDVLSDDKRRGLYDRLGHGGMSAGAGGARSGRGSSSTSHGGFPGGFEVDDFGSMFDAFFGGRSGGFGATAEARSPRSAARGQDVEVEFPVPFLTAARGGQEALRSPVDGQTIEVAVPAGTEDGARLRVRGAGLPGTRATSKPGDLILRVRVLPHPLFRREGGSKPNMGLDLVFDLPLTVAEATLGGRVRIPSLDGPIDLTVPPGTPSGRRLRVKGRGIRASDGRTGDLYAAVRIVPPDVAMLSPEQRRLIEEIGRLTPPPRVGGDWPNSAGR
ncbi:MAG: DnaJ domain-containing protein [Phycisphaeraceae bacterium]|nr:DnaJ domain-containing protein [Phycisphaeraceae bacterium]